MISRERTLPFSAIVGQEHVKRALLASAVNPRLNGVLIRGDKGTAKSTAARALAALLPTIRINEGCRFACPPERPDLWCDDCRESKNPPALESRPPFETLPLGVTEDQLLGTIDLEHALQHGAKRFQPGLLARVNQGVLYVDEVNLLEDHIVDLLLDSAAMGINVVAREGISYQHPAQFVLVGTMNPEEGGLRPQLLDRFGLCAEIEGIQDAKERAEVTRRFLEFEADPRAFRERWAESEKDLAGRISQARELLPGVDIGEAWIARAAELSLSLGVHGHRADILLIKTASTLAAFAGRTAIGAEDFQQAAALVYPHRLKRRPFEDAEAEVDQIARQAEKIAGQDKRKKSPAKKKSPKRRSIA